MQISESYFKFFLKTPYNLPTLSSYIVKGILKNFLNFSENNKKRVSILRVLVQISERGFFPSLKIKELMSMI